MTIKPNKREQIGVYLEFARPYYESKDAAHDFRHIRRVAARSDELAKCADDEIRLDRLCCLVAFHGLGGKLADDAQLAERITIFLATLGWSAPEIEALLAALARHVSDPQTAEERIVHDANLFEVTGPFGIAKAFTVGGARGQSYERTLEIFERNLDKATFRTSAARAAYAPRKVYAHAFIKALRADLEDDHAGMDDG